MEKANKYDLTEEEFFRCLKLAEMQIFMRSKGNSKPKSIFIVSQAGGGKTGLRKFVEAQKKDLFIEINPDEVAVYHKYYDEILREFPGESHALLQRFVQPALDNHLRQRAVQLRNNLIQEGTFGNTSGYLKILEYQKKYEYDIEIDILAVDRFESLLSSYEREQYFIETGLPPRGVIPEYHDRAYNNLLETVEEVEKRRLYNRIKVFKRGYSESQPELVHMSGDGRYPSVVECIKQTRLSERNKILANAAGYKERIEALKRRVKTKVQMDKIEKLEEEFNICLEQQKANQLEQD